MLMAFIRKHFGSGVYTITACPKRLVKILEEGGKRGRGVLPRMWCDSFIQRAIHREADGKGIPRGGEPCEKFPENHHYVYHFEV